MIIVKLYDDESELKPYTQWNIQTTVTQQIKGSALAILLWL